MMARPLDEIPMPKVSGSKSVPKSMQTTYEAITSLTDAFCREHLNADYRELALRMSAAHERCTVSQATEPPRFRTAPHLGLRRHLCSWPSQFPLRPVDAALHDHGGPLRPIQGRTEH